MFCFVVFLVIGCGVVDLRQCGGFWESVVGVRV